MSKPLGIDAMFSRVIMPTRAEDATWDAVEAARDENWSIERFIREAREAWVEDCKREAERAKP